MSRPSATVVADSISPEGVRLSSVEGKIWRPMLAELNTHRRFSRNSASNRAIPYAKTRARVLTDPAFPLSWPAEQKGMQGGEELDLNTVTDLQREWRAHLEATIFTTDWMHDKGLHKSVINRLLEPFQMHTVLITSTEWENFFVQRCSPLAQPEIRLFAEAVREALASSEPRPLRHGEWHTPYVDLEDLEAIHEVGCHPLHVSAARCARTSYLTHDGVRDPREDEELWEKLTTAQPPHWSPLEHVARPVRSSLSPWASEDLRLVRNFDGWVQLRTEVEVGGR